MSDQTDFRRSKDHFMKRGHDSPLTNEQKAGFSGLNYYDEDSSLRLVLDLDEYEDQEVIEMQTSTGGEASFLRWGHVSFDVEGTPAQLTVYKDTDRGDLFLPFADATSGEETYGAGRYLDVEPLPDGRLLVDFNYAYNPYCAYNYNWTCPITPPENRLLAPIRAGEKNFE